jgi:hypothetical protein
VTRPLQRRPDGTLEDPEQQQQAAPPPSPADRMLQLQQGAGNAALARVLAREPATDAPIQITAPGGGVPSPWSIDPTKLLPQLKPEAKRAVDAYLERQSGAIKSLGTPMPILIDEIRRNVPEAADADAGAIRDRVYAIVPGVPATRAGASLGQKKAEQEASIANRFPKPPTSVTVGNAQTYVKVEIVSAELKTPVIKAKVDKEGGEAEYEKGGAKVGVSGKWDGSEFGLKTEVGGIKFESKVHHKGEGWGWSGGLVIPLGGDEVDELPDVGAAVVGAHGAIGESLGHLQGGGSLTDGYVIERMSKIKPAIDAVSNVAGRKGKSGATLRITGSAEGGGWTAGVSLVIVF